jgi:hypothetical membrane protein
MKYKIIFGIAIPLFVIVALTIIASIDAGFSIDENYISELSLSTIYNEGKLPSAIKIADINIENDYFLGKRKDFIFHFLLR